MKRLLALVLAMTMILSLTACLGDGSSPTEPSSDPTTAPTTAPTETPKDTPDPPTEPTDDPKDPPSVPDEPEVPVEPEPITLKLWVPYEHISWLEGMLTKFEEEHPNYIFTWEVDFCSVADAATKVTTDPSVAADVFMFPNDQMEILASAGGLMPLDSQYVTWLEGNTSAAMIKSVTHTDDLVYGFPYTASTWFMYYNKDVYTEEDVKSLETMLEKGNVAFQMNNPWYVWSFYAAGGATIFGDTNRDATAGIKLGSKGADITRYLINLCGHKNFSLDSCFSGVEGLGDGTVDAMFTGDWEAPAIKKELGDRMGVAQPPTITVNGEQLQLQSFYTSHSVGVNQQSKHGDVAMELAAFLTSPEAQLARFEMNDIIPCATALENHAAILANPVAYAQMQTINNASCMQPVIFEMQRFWTPTGSMGTNIWQGAIKESDIAEETELFEARLNGLDF